MPNLPSPPTARRDADFVETLHGRPIADPYRWLEDTLSPETQRWIADQNSITQRHLDEAPLRESFRERLSELWNYPRRGAPWRRESTWFQNRNDGLQNHDVLWCATNVSSPTTPPPPEVFVPLLDVNSMSESGELSINAVAASPDGRFLAYALSDSGSDWVTWRVRDTASGEDLPDIISWSKFAGATWLPDSSGFFYGGYEAPNEGEALLVSSRNQSVRLHRLGTDSNEDSIVYVRPDQPESIFEAAPTNDGQWLVVSIWDGSAPVNRVHLLPLPSVLDSSLPAEAGSALTLLDAGDAEYVYLGADRGKLYFVTNHNAPRSRVVAIDPEDPACDSWQEIVAEGEDRILSARMIGSEVEADPEVEPDGVEANPGWITIETLHHATSRLEIFDRDGSPIRAIDLPPLATLNSQQGGPKDDHLLFSTASFTRQGQVFSHNLRSGETVSIFDAPSTAGPPLIAEQVFVETDDVRIPVFLIRRADQERGNVPTILYGYGGFDVAMTPNYSPVWRAWAERGGMVAIACLRGGGEYGREWHDSGRLRNKQNVFNDAIAVAKWLTTGEAAWTSSQRLGVLGRSNGGLLAGALLTQRPDLFAACVPEVGVLDMLRFHLFTIGGAWVSDYGSPDDPELFETLLLYSPFHNIKEGTAYPATLLTTGDHDDRVVPGHSFKFAAALQFAQTGANPILIRIDTAAGHGAGKPTLQLIAERADVLAFLAAHLRLAV